MFKLGDKVELLGLDGNVLMRGIVTAVVTDFMLSVETEDEYPSLLNRRTDSWLTANCRLQGQEGQGESAR